MQQIIGKHYKLLRKLGTGAFGEVYEAINLQSHQHYAIKLEKSSMANPQLADEYKKYNYLTKNQKANELGLSSVYYYANEGIYNVMVMDFLGPSLEKLQSGRSGSRFSLKTTVMIGIQLLKRLEFLHRKYFLHRDLKPDNFLTKQNDGMIFLIDFGLSKPYIDSHGKHIPMTSGKQLVGTARYASINTHEGNEQGRRDDLESLGYILVYFAKGTLPWQNLPAKNKEEKFRKIMMKKKGVSIGELCEGLPREFNQFMSYVKALGFASKPDYDYLNGLLERIMADNQFEMDFVYDWRQENLKEMAVKQIDKKETENLNLPKNQKISPVKDFSKTLMTSFNNNNNNQCQQQQNCSAKHPVNHPNAVQQKRQSSDKYYSNHNGYFSKYSNEKSITPLRSQYLQSSNRKFNPITH